jgi:hypothetical protein
VVTYVEVGGLRTWHEVHGEGAPVVLLHGAFLRGGYDPVSPDGPGHFPVVYAKTMQMLATEPELDLGSLAAVGAPTLVLQGDRDDVTLEHGAAVAAALPEGRLAVLPGTHLLPIENPEVVNALLLWFLRGDG